MDTLYESIVSTIDSDYHSKKDMNLSSFTRRDLYQSTVDKYKSEYKQLSHVRINKNTKGYIWLDGDSLVGFINVENKNGEKWINSFEIFGKYKKHGLSKQMMDVAMRDLKATHLSVNKKNNVAIKIYKSIGFNTYKETDTMLFMNINEFYIEESVKIINQIGNKETKDIQTVISSLDDDSFNDFKFKDIVYCDIRYKSKKPIAFITIRAKLINNSTVGYVSLAVNPKYQNQGIGKSLTEKAVSWFKTERGIHFLEWHCLQDNEASKKLANYAGFREYIAKGQEEYIHFTMESSNNESYIEESSYSKEIPDEIIDLLKRLNSYDYGYVKNGKKIKGMKNFFEDYKSLTISEFEKYEIGVCWDYVHYEAYWFSKHGYKYETFYIQVQDEDNDCPSHTYLVFYLPKSSKVYYFESSWGKYQGIEEFDNINELHKTIKDRHISSARSKCDPNTYFRNKYDAKSSSWEHLSCGEYMVKVSKGRIQLNESYIAESKKDSEYSYSSLSSSKDIADFNKNMQIVFKSKNDMNKEKTHKSMKAIKFNGEIIGYIGFSRYNIDGKKYLGIGNFMIIPRYQSSGHGTKIIKDLIDRYKGTYDEIYCYVEKENTKAIQFYKRIADVNTKNLTKYGYYVCLYRKGGSSTNESHIEESNIINQKDIYYNKDKFDSGEINLCFITGHSGSGKSTMARSMQNTKVEHYELDDLNQNYKFTDDNLKEYGDLIYSFFKGPGKKYRYHSYEDMQNCTNPLDDSGDEFDKCVNRDFVKYAMKYANSHKNTKFVIEGIWLYFFFKPEELKDYAVYIKGTSRVLSAFRAAKRDSKDADSKAKRFLFSIKGTISTINNKYSREGEKLINKYRNYYGRLKKQTNESYIEEFNLPKRPDEQKVSKEILDIVKPIILTSQNKSKASKLGLDLKCEITEVDSGMVFILILDGPQDKRDTEEARSLLKDLASKCKSKLSDIVSKVDIGDGDEGCLFFTMDKGKIRRKRKDLLESYTIDIKESDIDTKSIVFFTKNITPESLLKLYQFMVDPSHGINPLHGNIGVKISTGEYGGHNFLQPTLIKDLVDYLHGVVVECNTAYVGKRNTTEDHWNTIKAHGFLNIANCDIMDEDGDFPLPVKDPYHIKNNYVGDHLKRYDSILMLSHFKGHAMAGYGGALKNMSIGMASSRGKLHIHTAGEGGDMMKADRDKFLESMVDADMSVMDYMGRENILYVNVANNLSIDCDCDAHPKDPDISDIGIFASTDPVALDQACIDAVHNHPDPKKRNLINRINTRNGTHTIDCAYEKGLGNKHYVILDIDQAIEESSVEEDVETEASPKSFVKRSSLPAKNQKNHSKYLRKKAHSNKTNNATTQSELPKFNQIGELSFEEVAKGVKVKPIFIVTSYTNTSFGKAIKTFTHAKYTHAAIAFDTSLEQLYSFNADPKVTTNGNKGGISRESLSEYINTYDKAIIQVNCILCKESDFDIVKNTLDDIFRKESDTRYGYMNILNILIGRVKDTGMSMVCSQFVSYILHKADIKLVDKPDNLVEPKDLSTIVNPRVYKLYEGAAKDYDKKKIDRIFRKLKTKALLIKESLLEYCV